MENSESEKVINTNLFICTDTHILLGLKKRRLGAGNWNGFGGKIEGDASIKDALFREVKEESGIEPIDPILMGIVTFFSPVRPVIEMHVFKASSFAGEVTESEEMEPKWFPLNEVPYDKMWSDDKFWLPHLLDGKKFRAEFYFNDKDEIIKHKLRFDEHAIPMAK